MNFVFFYFLNSVMHTADMELIRRKHKADKVLFCAWIKIGRKICICCWEWHSWALLWFLNIFILFGCNCELGVIHALSGKICK